MFVVMFFLLNNCSSSENLNTQFKIKSNSKGFVTRSGTELVLDGNPYKFSGANQYYLFYKSQKMVDDVIEKAEAMGLNSIRTWGFCDGCTDKGGFVFQKEPGVYDENTFKKMDYIIAKASKHNIRLVIPFVNNWDDMGGMSQYTKWSMGYQDHDKFYTDTKSKEVYKSYVNYFLNRVNTITGVTYKNDPTILMWELTNEIRNRSDRSGAVVNAWIREMADFVKSIDDNHLLSTGMEGFMAENPNGDYAHNGFEGTDFVLFVCNTF
jgi:mannan endo-1,4-beta-mannosidase